MKVYPASEGLDEEVDGAIQFNFLFHYDSENRINDLPDRGIIISDSFPFSFPILIYVCFMDRLFLCHL